MRLIQNLGTVFTINPSHIFKYCCLIIDFFAICSGFSGFMIRYSDMMENISVNLSAQSGTVYLSPMLMQFWEPIWNGLSVYKEDGGVNGLILEGSVEVINFALQSIQYYGYFY